MGMSARLGEVGEQQLEGLLEWPRMAEESREWFGVPAAPTPSDQYLHHV